MTDSGDPVIDQAIRWHMSLADNEADHDWDAFVQWLEADPAHAAAYDLVEAGDCDAQHVLAEIPNALPGPSPANDNRARRTWWFGGGAVAAGLTGVLIWGAVQPSLTDRYSVATLAGETREIRLPSGDLLALNGASRITLDRRNPRFASVESGEALFRVTHDPTKPFEVRVGDRVIRDMGTVFNVVRAGKAVQIAVAEGSVLYDPDGAAVTLTAGQVLSDSGDGRMPMRATVDPAAVTGWTSGRLSYRNAPLARIVGDLERATGERLSVAQGLAGRNFTGTIRVDPDHDRMFADLAVLLNVRIESRTDGRLFVEADRAAH